MNEVNLTEDLKIYKAVVVPNGKESPKGYIAVAGVVIAGHETRIALPEDLMGNLKLFNKLAKQAQKELTSLTK